jgi:hypothetical protein
MVTVVNNPGGGDGGSGMGVVVIVLVIIVVAALAYFGIPRLRGDAGSDIDVKVNLPSPAQSQ